MLFTIVSLKDRSVDAFQQIQAVRSEGEAIRNFIDALNNEQSGPMYKHPDDFDLYKLGTFNDATGELISLQPPEKIGDGKQLTTKGA